jgi:hypothetical protein
MSVGLKFYFLKLFQRGEEMKNLLKNGRRAVLSTFLSVLLLSTAQAQIFTGPGFTIVDGGSRDPLSCSTVAVSGITTNVNVRSVTISNLNHTWLGDTQVMVYRPGDMPPPAFGVTISSPPDDRACNFAGTYRFIDTAAQTIDAATAGPCASATNLAPGDYRTSEYFGASGAGGPPTSLTTLFGTLTPAQANGNWLVCVFDYATPDGGTVGGTALQLTVLTAASVSVGGRVTANGVGISKANVTLTNSAGISRTVLTSPFGYYMFDDVSAGETYTVTTARKGYEFENPTRVITVNENMENVDFTAIGDSPGK